MSGRYVKISLTKTQAGNTTNLKISQLGFKDASDIIWGRGGGGGTVNTVTSVSAVKTHTGDAASAGDVSNRLTDNSGTAGWISWNTTSSYIIIDFGSSKTPTKWRYATPSAESATYAEAPVRWLLEISNDASFTTSSTLEEKTSDATITTSNGAWAANGASVEGNNGSATFFSDTFSAGGGGDPYIYTKNGQFYKMDNFTGFFRLIQGNLSGKQITINGYCQLDTKSEEKECNDIISNVLSQKNINIQEKYKNTVINAEIYQTTDLSNQSFIHLFYIRYGDEEIIVKIFPKLEILLNKADFLIDYKSDNKGLGLVPMYSDLNCDDSLMITINKLMINLSIYNNPQIRNGFSLRNLNSVQATNGILVNTLDMEHSELPILYSVEPVHNEDIPFKTQNCEFFIDYSEDTNSVQKNYAIKGFQTGIPIECDVSNIAVCL
jgi:hypothetical protein